MEPVQGATAFGGDALGWDAPPSQPGRGASSPQNYHSCSCSSSLPSVDLSRAGRCAALHVRLAEPALCPGADSAVRRALQVICKDKPWESFLWDSTGVTVNGVFYPVVRTHDTQQHPRYPAAGGAELASCGVSQVRLQFLPRKNVA